MLIFSSDGHSSPSKALNMFWTHFIHNTSIKCESYHMRAFIFSYLILACPIISGSILKSLFRSYHILYYMSMFFFSWLILDYDIITYFILHYLTLPYIILFYLTLPHLISSHLIISDLTLSYLIPSYHVLSYLIRSDQVWPCAGNSRDWKNFVHNHVNPAQDVKIQPRRRQEARIQHRRRQETSIQSKRRQWLLVTGHL